MAGIYRYNQIQKIINEGEVNYYLEPIPCGMHEKLAIGKKMVVSDDAAYVKEMQGSVEDVIFVHGNYKTMHPDHAVIYFDTIMFPEIETDEFYDLVMDWAEHQNKVFIYTNRELGETYRQFKVSSQGNLYLAMGEYDQIMHKLTLIRKNDILKIDAKEIITMRPNKAAEIIEDLLEEQRMNKMELSFRMGEDIRLFSQRMRKTKDFKLTKFIEMIETLGYTFMIEPTGIYRVSKICMDAIYEKKGPDGLYFAQGEEDDPIKAVAVIAGEITEKTFVDKTDALDWLKSFQKR